jgi:hypothetical protein
LLADEFAGTQEGSIHFHHLLPENGGCVRIAATIDDHVQQLSERLRDPEGAREETRRFVSGFVRPHGVERPATPIFVDAIERLAAARAPQPKTMPVWGYALRPFLLTGALVSVVGIWLQRPDPVRWLGRRAGKVTYRVRKRIGRTAAIARDRVRSSVRFAAKQWQKSVVKPLRARR